MKVVFRGRSVSKGKAEGEALVFHRPFRLMGSVKSNGLYYETGYELNGKNIKGKVIVCPCSCGCSFYFGFLLKGWGAMPNAIVAMKPYHYAIEEAIFSETPMVYGFDHNLLDIIETGDHVVVDEDNGTVTVIKKSG